MNTLKITHNAGFFSCCSKRLEGIVWFFNKNRCLPDSVDSSEQFSLYKSNPADDLTPLYFKDNDTAVAYRQKVDFYNDMQFLDYEDLDTEGLNPFIKKYFSPSDHVASIVSSYEKKYGINYSATCAVFYRGNDKGTETSIAPYQAFIAQARRIKEQHPETVFLVQTDETEFLEAFTKAYPHSISIDEIPHMHKQTSTIHDEMPRADRAAFGANFLAATIILSRCEYLVTHSGNCGLWAVLYRGHCDNVYQWLNNTWQRSATERALIRIEIAYKQVLKKILKRDNAYFLTSESSSATEGSFSNTKEEL